MEILNKKTNVYDNELITMYQFDNLSTPEEVIRVIEVFRSCGMDVKAVTASEFGDFDEEKKVITYTDMDELHSMIQDYAGIPVSSYNIVGELNETKFHSSIYPETNLLSIRYSLELEKEIDSHVQKVAK